MKQKMLIDEEDGRQGLSNGFAFLVICDYEDYMDIDTAYLIREERYELGH